VTIEASPSIEAPGLRLPSRLLLRGVRKRWDKRKPAILEDLDLELEPGAVVSLIGENGIGKTTLLRIVAGLIFADSGEVRLDGLDPRRDRVEYQSRLGFLSAGSGGLYARMSARQHLELASRIAFVRGSERTSACNDAIVHFGLGEFAFRRVDRLSMGQRQRVRLAMIFVHRPKLVLLDEPWNSLDEEGARVLADTLRAFRNAGGTAICCTPTGTELAAELKDVDVILRMKHGRLLPA
jgi:ABC-type multidrug transport system ATPase subunit